MIAVVRFESAPLSYSEQHLCGNQPVSRAAHAVKFWLLHRAARAVVVRARAHQRARLRVDRERLARLVAGPKPSVVLEVLPVEGRHAAALKQVGFHGDADAEGQRQHEDHLVAASRVLGSDEHARDKDHRCVKETGSDHCEHRATDGGTCEVTDTVGD